LPECFIRTADHMDLRQIARVHREAFPGFFLTKLGPAFLRTYYAAVLEFDAGILLVAEQAGSVVGFVGGFVGPKRFYEMLAARKRQFVLPILHALVIHPTVWSGIAVRVTSVLRGRRGTCIREEQFCELCSIGVQPGAARAGIGSRMVGQFLEHAAWRGAAGVYLTTDALQNDSVNGFYERLGFQLVHCRNVSGARPMNEYVMMLRKAA